VQVTGYNDSGSRIAPEAAQSGQQRQSTAELIRRGTTTLHSKSSRVNLATDSVVNSCHLQTSWRSYLYVLTVCNVT